MDEAAIVDIEALGEQAVLLRWADRVDPAVNRQVHAAAARLRADAPPWRRDVVPAYASLAVFFDDAAVAVEAVHAFIGARLEAGVDDSGHAADTTRLVEVPVRYGGEHGPDVDAVATHCGLAPERVAAMHAAGDYTVAMLGFSPGFPYLLGLDPALATPRLATPRLRVPAGSVGIGGAQTGVYPYAGPGGWQLLGRTPLVLFDPLRDPPSLLQPGDRVRFVPIDAARFDALQAASPGPRAEPAS